jgi:hypothetical protein
MSFGNFITSILAEPSHFLSPTIGLYRYLWSIRSNLYSCSIRTDSVDFGNRPAQQAWAFAAGGIYMLYCSVRQFWRLLRTEAQKPKKWGCSRTAFWQVHEYWGHSENMDTGIRQMNSESRTTLEWVMSCVRLKLGSWQRECTWQQQNFYIRI